MSFNFPLRQLPPLPSHLPSTRASPSSSSLSALALAPSSLTHLHFHDDRSVDRLPPIQMASDQPVKMPTLAALHHPYFPHTKILVPPRPFTIPTDQAFLEHYQPRNKRDHDTASDSDDPPLPSPKRKRIEPRKKATKLRKDRPVQAAVNEDIWYHIFGHTDPCTLLGLRTTCKTFDRALKIDGLWKECRKNRLPDAPEPPNGLSERRYMDLLEGSGCIDCGVKKSKRVQWAFLARFCEKCFKDKTMTTNEAQAVNIKYPDILLCIPRCRSDHWGTYCEIDHHEYATQLFINRSATILMLKNDITKIIRDYEVFLSTISPHCDVNAKKLKANWIEERRTANSKYICSLKACEEYDRSRESSEKRNRFRFAIKRFEFFAAKAEALSPTLGVGALQNIPGFRQACHQPRLPTERAWLALLKRIEQNRSDAELHITQNLARQVDSDHQDFYFDNKQSRRAMGLHPVLRQLAESVLENVASSDPADEDFVKLVFCGIWQQYQAMPEEDRPRANYYDVVESHDEDGGAYILCLDDAKEILQKKIVPFMSAWTSPRVRKALYQFRCPICTRKDYTTQYTFGTLFPHLVKHGKSCGSDMKDYYETSMDCGVVPECALSAIPWPRNLPMLAFHQKATGHWDPDDETPYQPKPPPPTIDEAKVPSAYEGRKAKMNASVDHADFANLVIHASASFSSTSIGPDIRSQIAWKYACDILDPPPAAPIDLLRPLTFAIMRTGDFSLFASVSCKTCALHDGRGKQVPRYGRMEYRLSELMLHLTEHHYDFSAGRKDWKTDLLTLPGESDVHRALAEGNMQDARVVFDTLFPKVVATDVQAKEEEDLT